MLKKIIDSMSEGTIFKISIFIEFAIVIIGYYRFWTLKKYDFLIISLVLIVIYNIVIHILKLFEPYYKSVFEMNRRKYMYEKINFYFDKVLPELRRTFPKTIYKYVELKNTSSDYSNEINNFYINENEKRFASLKENKVWLSNINFLNDPYEGKHYKYSDLFPFEIGFVDDSVAKKRCNQRSESFINMCERMEPFFYTSSFSVNYNNMPMWAHYASNYEGYCIEYEVVEYSNLYEVLYINSKVEVGDFMEELLKELSYGHINESQLSEILDRILLYSYLFKSSQWEYERELRTIFEFNLDGKRGINLKCDDIGLKIKKVFIGMNCSEENENTLRSICKELEIDVEKMIFNKRTKMIEFLKIHKN